MTHCANTGAQRRRVRLLTAGPFMLIGIAAAAAQAAPFPPGYTVTILRDPPTHVLSQAIQMNDFGQAVGVGLHQDAWFSGVRWSADGTPEDLGRALGFTTSDLVAINNNGLIAGTGAVNATVNPGKPFRYDPAATPSVQNLTPLVNRPQALNRSLGMSDNGVVAGSARTLNDGPFDAQNPFEVAVLWDETGAPRSLGALGDISFALDVNNSGLVVGRTSTEFDTFASGFLWDEQGGMRLLKDSGGQVDLGAIAYDVNNAGTFAGTSAGQPAVWFSESNATRLTPAGGAFGGEVFAINERNEMVGRSFISGGIKATLWIGDDAVLLDDLVGVPTLDIFSAVDINENGQILVHLTDRSGSEPDVLSAVLTPIPEPATALLLSAGLIALAAPPRRG